MILSLIASILFILTTYIIYKIQKDVAAPHYIMFFSWSFYMVMLTIFSRYFYTLSPITLSVYWIGANLFLLGSIIFNGLFRRNIISTDENKKYYKENVKRMELYSVQKRKVKMMIWIVSIVLLAGLIPYYNQQISNSGASIINLKSFFWIVRHAEIYSDSTERFSIINNLPIISRIAALYFYFIFKVNGGNNKIPTLGILLLFIIYSLLTGGRAELVRTMLALVGIEVIYEKKWLTKRMISIGMIMISISSIFAYFYGKSSINNDLSFFQNIDKILEDIVSYMLGGVVAFDNIIRGSIELPYNGGVFRFFMQTTNSLGADFEVGSLFMPFSRISDSLTTNIYSMYGDFSMHNGLIGIFFFTFLLGFLVSFIYSKVKKGKTVWIILYGQMISNMIMSGYSDAFYKSLNFQIKLIILVLLFETILRVKFIYKRKLIN